MVTWWNTKNQKLATTIGMGVTAYYVLSQTFTQIPAMPEFLTKAYLGPVSIVAVAAGLTAYGIILLNKF